MQKLPKESELQFYSDRNGFNEFAVFFITEDGGNLRATGKTKDEAVANWYAIHSKRWVQPPEYKGKPDMINRTGFK